VSRIRSIKPDFWTSADVMALSRDARLLFIGIWNFADDFGRFKWSPETIRVQVFPGDKDVTEEMVAAWMSQMVESGLLFRYVNPPEDSRGLQRTREESFGCVTGWHHQRVSHPAKSKLPDPLNCLEYSRGLRNPPEDSRILPTDPLHSAPLREKSATAQPPKPRKQRARTERDDCFDLVIATFEAAHTAAYGVPQGIAATLVASVIDWMLLIPPEGRKAAIERAVAGYFADPYWKNQGKHPFRSFSTEPGKFCKAEAPRRNASWIGEV
jgi:hypothetical protein